MYRKEARRKAISPIKKTITTSSLLPDEAYELLYTIKSDYEDDIEDLMSDSKFIDWLIYWLIDMSDSKLICL